MGWWYAVLKPHNTAPRLYRARDEDDAETQAEKAQTDGCEARVYETTTGDIHRAARELRGNLKGDFGYAAASGNILRGRR